MLTALDLDGATVTIDAMGCQREIVKTLVQRQVDYIIAVKNNQPTLAQAVEAAFPDLGRNLAGGQRQQDIDITKDHGRLETRRCVVSQDLSALSPALRAAWPGIRSLIMVESRREILSGERKGQVSTDWRYYISSRTLNATEFNQAIRQHWSIENSCHWVLDVNFGEDASRIRVGDGAQNFAILRRMALNHINQDKTIKASKKSKRQMAAWSTVRLQQLLGLQEQGGLSESAAS